MGYLNSYYGASLKETKKENLQGSKVEEKHRLLGDLFDVYLYLLRVISIFATFEFGGCLRS